MDERSLKTLLRRGAGIYFQGYEMGTVPNFSLANVSSKGSRTSAKELVSLVADEIKEDVDIVAVFETRLISAELAQLLVAELEKRSGRSLDLLVIRREEKELKISFNALKPKRLRGNWTAALNGKSCLIFADILSKEKGDPTIHMATARAVNRVGLKIIGISALVVRERGLKRGLGGVPIRCLMHLGLKRASPLHTAIALEALSDSLGDEIAERIMGSFRD
ncbi:MAG: hypothetical protein COU06_02670 [Candidatus Harrisonbacteria bacterium CG10_big_fil_rev_8_21_14_0_10_38_8]|uniref:Uncharacterized protein n=1 Tax=Candidatus Harrisonbacteria bacterium CG10_big_fil_rev_8_21_14_0_10_38_8 TaxID=1974582 RepID=A0A2M6WJF4_9BACT|nr:MAG: hypothetical protein COU06_02670 [Candidatus Harrisonbacteria bacterium CG10_big_fil_rev_8_21_14_0_10_38_8]